MSPWDTWALAIHEPLWSMSPCHSWIHVLRDEAFPGKIQHTAASIHPRQGATIDQMWIVVGLGSSRDSPVRPWISFNKEVLFMSWCQVYPGLRIPECSAQPPQSEVYKGKEHEVPFCVGANRRSSQAKQAFVYRRRNRCFVTVMQIQAIIKINP